VFLYLAVKDLFKDHLGLQPDYSQFLSSLITLPWSFKILYGLVADNFPIRGSRRKSYIMINSFCMSATMTTIAFNISENEIFITGLLIINSANTAFIDVVVDALMVTQSRNDQESGSEDLQTLSWILLAIGGIIGSIFSAYFTAFMQPWQTFLVIALFGVIQGVFAL